MAQTDIFDILSIVFFALSGAMLIVAVALFFKLKIPQVIGYLTGKTAAKKIREIEKRTTGEQETTSSKRMTAKIPTSPMSSFEVPRKNADDNLTEVLSENGMTAEATTVLSEATTVLSQSSDQTVVLNETPSYEEPDKTQVAATQSNAEVETDILLIHTDELIV